MKASIIIRTYNEEKKLGECLRAVCSQKTSFPFEVIIVDSESTDRSVSIAKRFPTKIVHMRKAEFTPGRASNIGCVAASGDYIAFLSGHSVPARECWLETLIRNFGSPDIAGVYGRQIPFPDCNPWEARLLSEEWPTKRHVQTDNPFFSLANAAIRKDLWEKIHFGEEDSVTEDQAWVRDAQRLGYGVAYDPEVVSFQSHAMGHVQACKRFFKEIRGLCMIHGPFIISKFFSDMPRTVARDIAFIRERRYGERWIARSLVRNALFFLTLLYAVVSLPCGRRWALHSVGRICSPLRLAYRISAALRLCSPAYGRFVDRVKERPRWS